MTRLLKALRSRKLAIWLLVLTAAWAFVATLIPRDPGSAQARAWDVAHPVASRIVQATGATSPYSWPPFLAALALLSVSTALCAWQRTRVAIKGLHAAVGDGSLPRSASWIERDGDPHDAVTGAEEALRAQGFRVLRDGLRLRAVRGPAGAFGSAVFHWSLVALFLTVGLGRMTRAEGIIGVPQGAQVANVSSEYGRYRAGRLHAEQNKDVSFTVTDMLGPERRNGVEIQRIPVVELVRSGRTVAHSEVYPNHPLRYSTMMVHYSDDGYVSDLRFVPADGSPPSSTRLFYDRGSDGRLKPASVDMVAQDGSARNVAFEVTGTVGAVALKTTIAGSAEATLPVVAAGGKVAVPGGDIVVERLVPYARLTVADDGSVYLIYGLFVTALAGLGVAIFSPLRIVRAEGIAQPKGTRLSFATSHQHRDPVFELEVGDLFAALATRTGEEAPSE